MRGHWNHNTHYHRELLRHLPPDLSRVLDVGCGDGAFARLLASRATEVVAIDIDPGEVRRARDSSAGVNNIKWETADLLTFEAPDAGFDAVTAIAVLHHLPFEDALTKMVRLLAPGGQLLVLGLWPATTTVAGAAVSAVASVVTQTLQLARGRTSMNSPARHPEMPLHEVRRRAAAVLPDVTVHRRLLWRYVLEWTKPPAF